MDENQNINPNGSNVTRLWTTKEDGDWDDFVLYA
jgi:hypothetical protein